MNLMDHQRKLLGLVRGTYRPAADDDPYILKVAGSRDLAEAQIIVFMWRIYLIGRMCPLTFNLLKQRKILQSTLTALNANQDVQPFRETQALDFLESLRDNNDQLVTAVAELELALLKTRQGDIGTYTMDWPFDPHPILYRLANGAPLDPNLPPGSFRIIVSRQLAGGFQIIETDTHAKSTRQTKMHRRRG